MLLCKTISLWCLIMLNCTWLCYRARRPIFSLACKSWYHLKSTSLLSKQSLVLWLPRSSRMAVRLTSLLFVQEPDLERIFRCSAQFPSEPIRTRRRSTYKRTSELYFKPCFTGLSADNKAQVRQAFRDACPALSTSSFSVYKHKDGYIAQFDLAADYEYVFAGIFLWCTNHSFPNRLRDVKVDARALVSSSHLLYAAHLIWPVCGTGSSSWQPADHNYWWTRSKRWTWFW